MQKKMGATCRETAGRLEEKPAKRSFNKRPGKALVAFLKRYRHDLLGLPCNRDISSLVDCCDFILDKAEGADV